MSAVDYIARLREHDQPILSQHVRPMAGMLTRGRGRGRGGRRGERHGARSNLGVPRGRGGERKRERRRPAGGVHVVLMAISMKPLAQCPGTAKRAGAIADERGSREVFMSRDAHVFCVYTRVEFALERCITAADCG